MDAQANSAGARSDDGRDRWQRRFDRAAKRDADFTTLSGLEVDPVYGPPPGAVVPGGERIGWPGEFPFTRGIHATGYRGKPWTIRQFSGFGSARHTNERYKMLLRAGGAGLSVAFDMPTLMGRDSDDPQSLGEVGHCGVAIDSAADMEVLFEGISLADTTTSMTISGPAVPLFCMYLVAAERQGADPSRLDGTLQTDIFKEYIAQKEWLFEPRPHLRLIGDLMQYCGENIPRYKPLSVSGYHIREAGSTAAQELAFTLADGFGYVELGLSRGLDVDEFAPGLSFFFDAHVDFFEEIAKFRAARRIWARWLRDVYGARSERALWLRFHTQTGGRLADRAAAGQQHRPDRDRGAGGGPRRDQLAAHQRPGRGARPAGRGRRRDRAAHPAGDHGRVRRGQRRRPARRLLVRGGADRPAGGRSGGRSSPGSAQMSPDGSMTGGILAGIENGWFIGEIAEASFAYQQKLEKGEKKIVGVNCHTHTVAEPLEILRISPEVEREQVGTLARRRAERDQPAVDAALAALVAAARTDENLVPPMLAAARAEATLGEICGVLRSRVGRLRRARRLLTPFSAPAVARAVGG